MTLLRVFPCLAILVLLGHQVPETASKGIGCTNFLDSCIPLSGDCCAGMTCQKGELGMFRCKWPGSVGSVGGAGGQGHEGVTGMCQSVGEACLSGVDSQCCPGLSCKLDLNMCLA